jgi:23S rRNA pseudouridine1911/1915/1917 synthase
MPSLYQNISVEFCVLGQLKPLPRLDVYLHEIIEGFTRSRLQRLIEEGNVLVEGLLAKASHKLKERELVQIKFPLDIPDYVEPQQIDLDIVFEDDDLVVVNKSAGMVTHPAAGNRQGTLVNALLHHCQGSLSGISGVLRPGIVHRLDKDTSGLIVVAKNDTAHQSLSQQIQERSAQRKYLVVVEGVVPMDSGTVDKPIGRASVERKQMMVSPSGKRAVSHFTVLARSHKYTLAKVTLDTGRTHQIRVHMASMGYPVAGDILYNHKSTGSLNARHKLGLTGQALHAYQLSFVHPSTGKLLEFESAPPPDLARFIESITGEGGAGRTYDLT